MPTYRFVIYRSLAIILFGCFLYVSFPTMILQSIIASRHLLEPFGLADSLQAHKVIARSLVATMILALGWIVRRTLASGRRHDDAH